MASKNKQKSALRNRASAIQVDSNTTINDSNSSVNSSNRWSRIHEKETLSNLNDRLASYIERVRNLESENNRLCIQIRDVEIVEKKEKDDLSNRYESKISDLRKQLDLINRDKAKLEIERSKAVDGIEDLKKRYQKLENDLKKAEQDIQGQFKETQTLQTRYNNAENSRKIAENENSGLKKELIQREKQLATSLQELEDEVVLRTELENKLATYKEDLEFARRNHNNQIEELRRKRQIEMTSYSTEVENRYQNKLQEQLQNLRADFDNRIAQNRAEVDDLYKSKLNEAVENANRQHSSASEARDEAGRQRLLMFDLENKLKGHDSKVEQLNRRIQDLENALHRSQEEADLRLKQRDERIHDLEADAANMLNDYQDLLDVKVQLDTELQAYQKLLESEETRLHITPNPSPNASQSNVNQSRVTFESALTPALRRGIKRKHLEEDNFYSYGQLSKQYTTPSESQIDVIIDTIDVDGKFICLANKGESDFVLGKWIVKSVDGKREVCFKFHSKQILKAGKSIMLCSNNSGMEHAPPTTILMKNQIWPSGDRIRVELMNEDGSVMAWGESILISNYQLTENGEDPDKRCSLM